MLKSCSWSVDSTRTMEVTHFSVGSLGALQPKAVARERTSSKTSVMLQRFPKTAHSAAVKYSWRAVKSCMGIRRALTSSVGTRASATALRCGSCQGTAKANSDSSTCSSVVKRWRPTSANNARC